MNKKVVSMHPAHPPHMVGDGLPVRNFFSYNDFGRRELSPFLMLDYGYPSKFAPTDEHLGVGMHPHRGFETVTLVFSGQIRHRDTAGNHGEIGPGDVQWMTAGSGVLHEEMHSEQFRKNGGELHFLQLWVNLPANKKMTSPKYQTLLNSAIPSVVSADGKATVRVVAGEYQGTRGPAETITPVNLFDVTLKSGAELNLKSEQNYTTALIVLEGTISVHEVFSPDEPTLVVLDREGATATIRAEKNAHVIVLNGEPIDEPVVGYGPFVMNTQEQIFEAIKDFQSGRFAYQNAK